MEPIIGIYLGISVVLLIGGVITLVGGSFKDKKNGSRVMLIAPIWPVLAPVFLFKGVGWLWEHADWRDSAEAEEEERLERVRSRW